MDESKKETFLEPFTVNEVKKIVLSLKETATGYDDIGDVLLKMSAKYIGNPLSHIRNLSFLDGVFPDSLKIANVIIPLYKAEDPMCFSNYRPVSLLCTLAKVFDRLMYKIHIKFLENFKILNEHQFGFKKVCSTHTALLALVDNLIQALKDNEYALGVFSEFSKAFDTIDHFVLLDELNHYGVRGCAYHWF